MAKSPPSFDFFPRDFLTAVSRMSYEEIGLYVVMLCEQWEHGSLPKCSQKIAKMLSKSSPKSFQKVLQNVVKKFTEIRQEEIVDFCDDDPDEIVLVNRRLHEMRQKQVPIYLRRVEINRENGSSGGRPSKQNRNPQGNPQGNPHGFPYGNPQGNPNGNPKETQIGRGKREEGRKNTQYGNYPSKSIPPEIPNSPELRNNTVFSCASESQDLKVDRFGETPKSDCRREPEIQNEATHVVQDEREAPKATTDSPSPPPNASTGLLGVPPKPKLSFFQNPQLPTVASIMFGSLAQPVTFPKSHATERAAKAVQRWVDHCHQMKKPPQVMSLEAQLIECARVHISDTGFAEAITRSIRDNCDPHNFKPRIWSKEIRAGKYLDPDPEYQSPEQLKAAGAI